ncbi:XRE family transcriptional regulator [Actinocrinis puniceicyclus]|uniref:XRE family transcriptional regulator n=1 Tax=Actinocrinis puniceicyclus TaxID=977794 RepID=A0A8J8BD37_9ACTN|nr:helix-turn-helix domain-containing protein [Actinocrinis puniceicyclus]MBS2964180.1 XRE family transcriptional regulator [Actinocrinis puniceicyclus]
MDGGGFGQFLIDQRKAIGWTQEELAERSNLSVRTIRNLEGGYISNPRRASVELLLDAFSSALSSYSGQPAAVPAAAQAPAWRTRAGGSAEGANEAIVGRAEDLRHLAAAVRNHRLVVLTGPGGVGKTRLAAAAGAQLRTSLRDGFAIAELGRLAPQRPQHATDENAVREVLNAALRAAADPADPRLLLLVDTAEHVVTALTQVAQQLLDDCPHLRLIVTSRRPLPLAAAHVWEVGPLDLGANEEGRASPAVELFLRRAQASCPTLDLGGRMAAVAELCRRLDGMPLAIELAAHRVRSVSLDTLLRDGPGSQVLGRAAHAGLPHQATLAESVRWSYELLAPNHRALLHELAGFAGPFTIEDLEQLRHRAATPSSDLVGQLSELVDESLVQVRRGPQYKYRLLSFVGEYVRSLQVVRPRRPAHV